MKPRLAHRINTDFTYTSSAATDVRKTFARIRRQLAENEREAKAKVKPLQAKREAK